MDNQLKQLQKDREDLEAAKKAFDEQEKAEQLRKAEIEAENAKKAIEEKEKTEKARKDAEALEKA